VIAVLLLSAGSGLLWGTADFLGGLQSRRIPALSVTLWSQFIGGLTILIVSIVSGQRFTLEGFFWGMGAGAFGGMALLSFYRGLAVGAMSIVAPVSACGAVVPVLVSFGAGHVPSVTACIGIGAAMLGIVLVSLQAPAGAAHPSEQPRLALGLALLAALGFGMFYVLLNRGGQAGTSILWPVVGVKAGSMLLLVGLVIVGRQAAPWPGKHMPVVSCVGFLDTSANALWASASTMTNLGIVAVLGSLYPVATVLLGRIVLSERLSTLQKAGVALALVGVALVSR
jgi:drug/metabolite transporter (DMT)-like permease